MTTYDTKITPSQDFPAIESGETLRLTVSTENVDGRTIEFVVGSRVDDGYKLVLETDEGERFGELLWHTFGAPDEDVIASINRHGDQMGAVSKVEVL